VRAFTNANVDIGHEEAWRDFWLVTLQQVDDIAVLCRLAVARPPKQILADLKAVSVDKHIEAADWA